MAFLTKIAEKLLQLAPIDAEGHSMIAKAQVDLLGCILEGQRKKPIQDLTSSYAILSSGPAPIIGTDHMVTPPHAALVNAAAGHIMDLDDWDNASNSHPTTVLLPALWALTSLKSVSGNEVQQAYAVGLELLIRMGEALNYEHYNRGWHTTATLGTMAVAAACGTLLKLPVGPLTNALSLALSQSAGMTCQFGSNTKCLQAGFAAQNGLNAALIAEAGLTAQPHALEGETGFLSLMSSYDQNRLPSLVDSINGQGLAQHKISFKAYPSCAYTHRLIDAALTLRKHPDFNLDNIESMTAKAPDFHYAILPFQTPKTGLEGLFSIPYCIAAALVDGKVTLSSFTDEAVMRPELIALTKKIIELPQTPDRPHINFDPLQPDHLDITMCDGQHLEHFQPSPLGSLENPMSKETILEKFQSINPDFPHTMLQSLSDADRINDMQSYLQSIPRANA